MFSEVAEIARVAQRRGQFQQLLKTQVILILNFNDVFRVGTVSYGKNRFQNQKNLKKTGNDDSNKVQYCTFYKW